VQSWWNFEGDVWGRVGVILKTPFVQSWWNCEDGIWGRDGGIVKTMFVAELVEL